MLTVPSPLEALQNGTQRRVGILYRLTRSDAVVKYLTEHDSEIVIGSETYKPAGLVDASARRWQSSLKPSSFDARGIIDSTEITEDDLHAGRYDDCKVEEIIVDWRYPWAGQIVSTFWIDQITRDGEAWTAELSGPPRWLRRKIGAIATRNCPRILGDAGCQVNLTSFTRSGVVVAGTEDGPKKMVILATSSIGAFSDGYFADGFLTFTSGGNNGLQENVKLYRSSDRRLELQGPMPFAIEAGDTFDIVAGCDKLYATCGSKFANAINYGGFLFIPGTDKVLRTPTRR